METGKKMKNIKIKSPSRGGCTSMMLVLKESIQSGIISIQTSLSYCLVSVHPILHAIESSSQISMMRLEAVFHLIKTAKNPSPYLI